MRIKASLLVLLALSAAGCGSTGWLKAPSLPFAKKDRPPETVSEMLASGSTQSSKPKAEASSVFSFKKKEKADATSFIERLGRAKASEQAGKYDAARNMYERLIVEYPDRPESYHRLGVVADRQQRHREAQSLYTQALILKPMDAEILNDLGYCFFLQGKLAKAESALMKGVSISPSDERVRNNLGMVLAHLNRDDEALEQFRRAGSEADAQYNLAFAQVARGEVEQARKRLEMALISDPAHEQARLALEEIDAIGNKPLELADSDARNIPAAPPKPGRYVPYLEDNQLQQPTAALTGGSEPLTEVGEGSPALHDSQHFQPTFGSQKASNALDMNAAARSLQASGYTEQTDSQTQALQARARAMMEARLRTN